MGVFSVLNPIINGNLKIINKGQHTYLDNIEFIIKDIPFLVFNYSINSGHFFIKNICKIIKNWYNIHVVNLLSNLLFQLNYKVNF